MFLSDQNLAQRSQASWVMESTKHLAWQSLPVCSFQDRSYCVAHKIHQRGSSRQKVEKAQWHATKSLCIQKTSPGQIAKQPVSFDWIRNLLLSGTRRRSRPQVQAGRKDWVFYRGLCFTALLRLCRHRCDVKPAAAQQQSPAVNLKVVFFFYHPSWIKLQMLHTSSTLIPPVPPPLLPTLTPPWAESCFNGYCRSPSGNKNAVRW